MSESEDNIPTLTHIARAGEPDMLNHFDGHQFTDENHASDVSFSIENATDLENDIPSINIENSANTSNEDFSDAMQSAVNTPPNTTVDVNALKQKIDTAIKEAMPGIEAQLKGKLYSQFDI